MASLNNAINMSQISTVKVQIFTVGTSTYTPSTGLILANIKLIGGGGGSGGSACTAGQIAATGGAGAGGYSESNMTPAQVGATATVVIGAAGAAGASGNHAGGTGGDSTFTPTGSGSVMTANGGNGSAGGAGTAAGANFDGTTGGAASGGNVVNLNGGPGQVGATIAAVATLPGAGGSSYFTPPGYAYTGTRAAAMLYGGGGPGVGNITSADVAGEAGSSGVCIITEYCNQ